MWLTVGKKKSGLTGSPSSSSDTIYCCFNCGSPDHCYDKKNPGLCPLPCNEQRYNAAKKRFYDSPSNSRGNGGKPRRQRRSSVQQSSGQAQANVGQFSQSTSQQAPSTLLKFISREDGTPMILNKQGNYAVATKRYQAFINKIAAGVPDTPPASPLLPKPALKPALTPAIPSSNVTQTPARTVIMWQSDAICAALRPGHEETPQV